MAEQNVELVRSALDAWNRLDDEAILQLFSPDAELDASGRILNPDIYTGIEGLMRFRRDIAEAWDRFELEIEDLFESGSLVVVFVRSIGIGRASGIEVDFRSAWLVTVSDQKITRLRLYRERREALKAAGLSE
jgi:ketosteroid isomerase-like protein